jgi:hypothetical protein
MSDEKPKQSSNYPRRNYNQDAHKKYVDLLIGRIEELGRRTNPAGGADTAQLKDFLAFQALEAAGRLVDALAGWAIDHQIGLALKGLQFVPRQPSGTREHPEYLSSKLIVDDHAHERAGGLASTADLTPEVMRKIWINLVNANPWGVGYYIQATLWHALKALDYGEVHPIFQPARTKRKRDLTEMVLQLRALSFVEYRRARGKKKKNALDEVANALGVDLDTIRSWELRLRRVFGNLEVDRGFSIAKNAASNENHAERQSSMPVHRPKDAMDRGVWEAQYGYEALQQLAETYKAALKRR